MKSIHSTLSLDRPGAELPPDNKTRKSLLKQLKNIKYDIKDELDEFTKAKNSWEFDRSDKKWNINNDFFGSNPLSLVQRNQSDKTSFEFLRKRKENYLFCIKSDGTRYLWVVTQSGGQFFFSRSSEIFVADVQLPAFFYKKKNCEMILMRSEVNEERLKDGAIRKVRMEVDGKCVKVPGVVGRFESFKTKKMPLNVRFLFLN